MPTLSGSNPAGPRADHPWIEGFEVLNCSGGWEWREGFELFATVENATDEKSTHHLRSLDPFAGRRIPEMGRSVSLGVRLRR